MKIKTKKHTRSSLNLYLVAGLYLLYIDYSLISKWSDIQKHHKILTAIVVVGFAIFACSSILYALKGIKDLKQAQENIVEEIEDQDNI